MMKTNNDDDCGLIFPDGTRKWILKHNEKHVLHRIGGYAIIEPCGIKEYWVYGKKLTEEQHGLLYSTMKLKGLL